MSVPKRSFRQVPISLTVCRFQWNYFLNIFHAIPPPTVAITPNPLSRLEGQLHHISTLCLWRHTVETSVFHLDTFPPPKRHLSVLDTHKHSMYIFLRGIAGFPIYNTLVYTRVLHFALISYFFKGLVFITYSSLWLTWNSLKASSVCVPVSSSFIFSSFPVLLFCSFYHNSSCTNNRIICF